MDMSIAIQNRLRSIDRFAWPGLEQVLPDNVAPITRWFREHWYDPHVVLALGRRRFLLANWLENGQTSDEMLKNPASWATALVQLAEQVLALYGTETAFLDYAYLQSEVTREQSMLSMLEAEYKQLQLETVRPLYRQSHPSRNLETLYGVGQDGAAVYSSFIGDPKRFPDHASFRGWSGMIPRSSQSGTSEAKGLPISQAGPDLIKKFSFLGAETAGNGIRRSPPSITIRSFTMASIIRKPFVRAPLICSIASGPSSKKIRAYELRDVDGTSGECRASSKDNCHPLQCAKRSSAA